MLYVIKVERRTDCTCVTQLISITLKRIAALHSIELHIIASKTNKREEGEIEVK
jgi:hypothetical protein